MTNTVAAAESDSRMVHMPGDGAMWVMVIGDLFIFGAYFIIFMVHRAMKPGVFLASQQHLNITIGVVNTLVLLASSWFIARSVQCTRAGEGDRGGTVRRCVALVWGFREPGACGDAAVWRAVG